MKKMILAFACLIAITVAMAAPQNTVSQTEVYNTIMNSREANIPNGVFNPDKIDIGQTLTFVFRDGVQKTYTVSKGQSQWKIVENILKNDVPTHGALVNPTEVKPEPTGIALTAAEPWYLSPVLGLPMWLWLVVLSALLFAAVRSIINQRKDPATSGTPMRAGGITAENRVEVMTEIAQRQYPGQTIEVIRTQRGLISATNALVTYAIHPERRTFRRHPGYRATVRVNGTEQIVYGLERCGNDVRIGRHLIGNITFEALETEAIITAPERTSDTTHSQTNTIVSVTSRTSFEMFMDALPDLYKEFNATPQDTQIKYVDPTTGVSFELTATPKTLPTAEQAKEAVKSEERVG